MSESIDTQNKEEELHKLCDGARAIPPSPLMLENGNNYNTCSKCGEKADAPDKDVSSVETLGNPDSPILLKFRELKKLRNNRHMDEPDFDKAVMELIESHANSEVLAVLSKLSAQQATCHDCIHDDEELGTIPYVSLSAIEAEESKYGKA